MQKQILLEGRVAYDVENGEWVMFEDDRFIDIRSVVEGLNDLLERKSSPLLKPGDELQITIRRSSETVRNIRKSDG